MSEITHQNPPGAWRWRQREAAWLAAAVIGACLLVVAWPAMDMQVSGMAYVPGQGFAANTWGWVRAVYEAVPWIGRGLAVLALLCLIFRKASQHLLGQRWRRRMLLLGLALLLGVGGMVNGVLKEGWGRPRPVAMQAFGGDRPFMPALRPSKHCKTNCSFVSGHAATGFVLSSVGLLGAASTRRRWLAIGMVAGAFVGGVRVIQGGHFLSDVIFCALVMWACNLVIRELWLRRVARRRRKLRGADASQQRVVT